MPRKPKPVSKLLTNQPQRGGALEREAESKAVSELYPIVRENPHALISHENHCSSPHLEAIDPHLYTPTHVQLILVEYYDRVDIFSREWVMLRASITAKWADVLAGAGIVGLCRLRYLPDRSFEFDEHGVLSVVVEALDKDAKTVVDLVAWPVHRPDKFAPALRRVRGLGLTAVDNPATYFGGRPLKVFKTPLAWLAAGCSGVVIVDPRSVFSWLGEALGPIAGEDLEHGREIARALHPYVDPSRILAPIDEVAA